MPIRLADIEARIRVLRLEPRGAFQCAPQDQVPAQTDGVPARSLVLIGTIGSGFWPAFDAARSRLGDHPHPLDAYSRQIITALAGEFGAMALFPFEGPPWLPFTRWAQRAEAVHAAPIGPLIHPHYGLWHAYRGALSFDREITGISTPARLPSPCDSCKDKPCLSTCPVAAFSEAGYAVSVCRDHLHRAAGRRCMESGCLARQACPVGAEYRYRPDHARFHMQAFLKAHSTAPAADAEI